MKKFLSLLSILLIAAFVISAYKNDRICYPTVIGSSAKAMIRFFFRAKLILPMCSNSLLAAIMQKPILVLMANILFFKKPIQRKESPATRYGWEKYLQHPVKNLNLNW